MAQNIGKRRIVEGALKGGVAFRPQSPNLFAFFFGCVPFQYSPFSGIRNLLGLEEGGGGTPLNKLYRYVPPQRVGFMRSFGLETSIDFVYFGLESGVVFDRTTRVCERIYHFSSKW